MPQVLEAQPSQAAQRMSTAIEGGYPTLRFHKREARRMGTAEKARQFLTWCRSIVSALTRPTPYYIPQCADTRPHNETALDLMYRIDPYLYIKSLAG